MTDTISDQISCNRICIVIRDLPEGVGTLPVEDEALDLFAMPKDGALLMDLRATRTC